MPIRIVRLEIDYEIDYPDDEGEFIWALERIKGLNHYYRSTSVGPKGRTTIIPKKGRISTASSTLEFSAPLKEVQ